MTRTPEEAAEGRLKPIVGGERELSHECKPTMAREIGAGVGTAQAVLKTYERASGDAGAQATVPELTSILAGHASHANQRRAG